MRPNVEQKVLTINLKSDTYMRWKEYNPVLQDGEIACVVFSREKVLYKLGDGVTEFSKLRYVSLEDALRRGYTIGYCSAPGTNMYEVAACINVATEAVYERLTEEDLAIGAKI